MQVKNHVFMGMDGLWGELLTLEMWLSCSVWLPPARLGYLHMDSVRQGLDGCEASEPSGTSQLKHRADRAMLAPPWQRGTPPSQSHSCSVCGESPEAVSFCPPRPAVLCGTAAGSALSVLGVQEGFGGPHWNFLSFPAQQQFCSNRKHSQYCVWFLPPYRSH